MNRTIKFRAWDCGVMVKPFGLLLRDSPYILETLTSETTLMQFTGLKDKNGKEIYEGDILKCQCERYANKNGDSMEREKFDRNSVIEWWQSENRIGYRLRDGKGKTLDLKNPWTLRNMQSEVIGNIYENPELLKCKA